MAFSFDPFTIFVAQKVLYTEEVKKIKEKHEHEMHTQHQIYDEERIKLKSEIHELEINVNKRCLYLFVFFLLQLCFYVFRFS